ncbi:ser/threonine protein phosphatase [Candidatus Magnetoovum chiemensis]|nr:ser/threonine protein phosphatase [Candidatus Magnetoovum chiemensis]
MKVLLSRLRRNAGSLEYTVAVAMILLSSYQFGVAIADGQRRGAAVACLIFLAGLCWQRTIFRRRTSGDATKALAGFAAAAAMLLRGDMGAGRGAVRRPSGRHEDQPTAFLPPHHDTIKVKTLFISDVHLGTRGCQADLLVEFLRRHDAETVFLVGDIVDGWRLKSNWYWPKSHNDVVQELLSQACRGKRLVYVAGNHDEFLRDHAGSNFGGIEVVDRVIHRGVDGRDYLVIHGDHFDFVVRHARWLALLGDWAYRAALVSNVGFNHIRSRFGLAYWSFSAWAKSSVKNAVSYIGRFEEVLCAEARRHDAQGVICGHIHHAVMHDDFGVRYINTGDWVETCSGVVEHHDGRFEIIRWTGRQSHATARAPAPLPLAKEVA